MVFRFCKQSVPFLKCIFNQKKCDSHTSVPPKQIICLLLSWDHCVIFLFFFLFPVFPPNLKNWFWKQTSPILLLRAWNGSTMQMGRLKGCRTDWSTGCVLSWQFSLFFFFSNLNWGVEFSGLQNPYLHHWSLTRIIFSQLAETTNDFLPPAAPVSVWVHGPQKVSAGCSA